MKKTPYKTCEHCIFETDEYKEVLEKNPDIEERLIKNNKYRSKNQTIRTISMYMSMVGMFILWIFVGVNLYGHLLPNLQQTSFMIVMLVVGITLIILGLLIYCKCMSRAKEILNSDLLLHKEFEQAFKKCGY